MSEQQKGLLSRRMAPKKENKKPEMFISIDGKIYEVEKMARGGRAGLKGGGICKRGMNRKAVGKNS
jgi:hypothetical protein